MGRYNSYCTLIRLFNDFGSFRKSAFDKMWIRWFALVVAIVNLCALVSLLRRPDFCETTYFFKEYREVPMDSKRYRLIEYREKWPGGERTVTPSGLVPVLFLPGSGGEYQQVMRTCFR